METVSDPLNTIFEAARTRTYKKGQLIRFAGDNTQDVHRIKKGFVKAYTISEDGENKLLRINGRGDIFPLNFLITDPEEDTYYEAMDNVTLLSISQQAFRNKLAGDNELTLNLIQQTLMTLQQYNGRIKNLEILYARGKLISRIAFLAKRFGRKIDSDQIELQVPINFNDLADSINMARDTANRECRKLAREGLIRKGKNRLTILKWNKLLAELNNYPQ